MNQPNPNIIGYPLEATGPFSWGRAGGRHPLVVLVGLRTPSIGTPIVLLITFISYCMDGKVEFEFDDLLSNCPCNTGDQAFSLPGDSKKNLPMCMYMHGVCI